MWHNLIYLSIYWMFTDIFNTVFLQMSETHNDLRPNIANKRYLSVLFKKKKYECLKRGYKYPCSPKVYGLQAFCGLLGKYCVQFSVRGKFNLLPVRRSQCHWGPKNAILFIKWIFWTTNYFFLNKIDLITHVYLT